VAREDDSSRKRAARTQAVASALLFGLMAALARLGSRAGGEFTWAQMATVRFALGTLMTAAIILSRPASFRPVRRRLLVTRGVLGGAAVLFYFVALSRIPAGAATMLQNLYPVIATIMSFWGADEQPTVHLAAALALVTAGVVLVVGPGSGLGFGLGEAAALVAAILGAAAVTSIRVLRATDSAVSILLAFHLGGLVCCAPLASGAWPRSPAAWSIALGVSVTAFLAQALMTEAYGALTVAEAALWQQLAPIAAFLWAVPVLGEDVSVLAAIGMVIAGFGVAYGSVLGHRPARAAARR
jgi:drug/metabolite transporter (DMT)-like permease